MFLKLNDWIIEVCMMEVLLWQVDKATCMHAR